MKVNLCGVGLLLLWTLGCSGPVRREIPLVEFAQPSDTILTQYVNIPVAAWVQGSRWAVVSGEFNEAAIIDFGSGSRNVLGGTGEREIRNPFDIYTYADTVTVTDWALRRATIWSAEGDFIASIPAVSELRGALPKGRDAAGQLYFEVSPPPGPAGSGNRDSAAIVRSTPGLVRFDTVGRLSPLDLAEVEDATGRRFERRVFSGSDEWGVLPDGAVWLARVYPPRTYWILPSGRVVKGEALPDRLHEVTQVDRQQWLQQFPEELRSTAENLPFSPLKPAFEAGSGSPNGTILLERSRAAVDTVREYHVVDREGVLRYIAVLPLRHGHVIAVGDSVALVAEQYREGVRLMQVRVPRPAPLP